MPSQHPPELATVGDLHRALDQRHAYLLQRFDPFHGAVYEITIATHTVLREFCKSMGIDFDRRQEILRPKLQRKIRILLCEIASEVNTKLIKLSGAYNPEEN
jgi:hypothetical protein